VPVRGLLHKRAGASLLCADASHPMRYEAEAVPRGAHTRARAGNGLVSLTSSLSNPSAIERALKKRSAIPCSTLPSGYLSRANRKSGCAINSARGVTSATTVPSAQGGCTE
jgi:hypothetical protein